MFQLEILDMHIVGQDWNCKDTVLCVACRAVFGDLPLGSHRVWVYGTGKPTIKATMSHVWGHPRDAELLDMAHIFGSRNKEVYVLYVTPGEEIVVGMMISDAPRDTLESHARE